MPIFEYRCKECGQVTEFLEERHAKGEHKCESCSSSHTEKMLSTFGVQVKSPTAARSCDQCCSARTCPYS